MSALLDIALDAAVPLWIEQHRDTPVERRVELAHELAPVVAEKGDVLQFRGGRKGETAKAFNALAEGIALAAFVPGGIEFRGRRWEA